MGLTVLVSMALLMISTLLFTYAIRYNSIATRKKSEQRLKGFKADKKSRDAFKASKVDEKQRRKTRENTLKNIEEQRSSGKKAASPALPARLAQAGMSISVTKFYILSFVMGVVSWFLSVLFLGAPFYICIGLGIVAGLGLPRWFVNFKRKRRFNSFIKIFPNAIDIIVRGIRSGLPLNDCFRIIASDAEEPVRGEFRKIVEASQMGISIPEACDRLYQSVPTPETNFFAIVIAIQSSAGGNLSEALSNLSKVLRERKKMADKVTAFSTEAKTSAIIIGSLPFIVAGLVHLTTPSYLVPLFTTDTGHKVLFFCALSMGFGIFVMKKMISFKF